MRVDSPRAMAGQPSRCGAVGPSKTARNQAAVMGWKSASAVSAEGTTSSAATVAALAVFFGLNSFDLAGLRGMKSFTLAYFGLSR